jgi:hypothetical protein
MNEGENIFLPGRKANSLGRLCFTDSNTKKHFIQIWTVFLCMFG